MSKDGTTRFFSLLKENNAEFVDFRFTDPRGKWQHTTYYVNQVDEDLMKDGIMFDGSSIAGWKDINESDMILMPDGNTAFMDPFASHPTAIVFCDVIEPSDGKAYERDARSTALRAEAYLKETGIGDKAFFGPELEFFVFDDVRYDLGMMGSFYRLDAEESPINTGKDFDFGNMGHRPGIKGGYFPVPPVDSMAELRSECLRRLAEVGIEPVLHHHEVAPAQNELGINFSTLVQTADNVQKYKYVVQMVAHEFGKTATFMPKPVANDNGSGMHVHQSIWKGNTPLFAGDKYAGLSDMCLHYIGGVIKHARALNAFTNASTNSYKRLVPGYEAPTLLCYSSRNRSASIRIPHVASPKAKRLETRFPDSAGNPYLTFSALLMAGLDGIKNKIDPGEALEKDLYSLSKEETKDIPAICSSLRQALKALDEDREFLKAGGVFNDELIDGYIELKEEEVARLDQTPSPVEFAMYYSV